jgi:hypothetical protein
MAVDSARADTGTRRDVTNGSIYPDFDERSGRSLQ